MLQNIHGNLGQLHVYGKQQEHCQRETNEQKKMLMDSYATIIPQASNKMM